MAVDASVMAGTFQALSSPQPAQGHGPCIFCWAGKGGTVLGDPLRPEPANPPEFSFVTSSLGSAGSQVGAFTEPQTMAQEMGRKQKLRSLAWSQDPGWAIHIPGCKSASTMHQVWDRNSCLPLPSVKCGEVPAWLTKKVNVNTLSIQ